MNLFDTSTSLADLSPSALDEWTDTLGNGELTNAMVIAWLSRPDLQLAFDLQTESGRSGLKRWCRNQRYGKSVSRRLLRGASRRIFPMSRSGLNVEAASGVNLVGYVRGVLGMGEHVRMSALSMGAAHVPCGIVDFTLGLGRRRQPLEGKIAQLRQPKYRCSLFHVNADQMMRAYWHFGREFFANRYNIGYWAWELANWPAEWIATIATVDEIWAPSRFVRDALSAVTRKSVQCMPVCVELPTIKKVDRSEFGVAADEYVFLFTFDCHSYFERKNPLALIRAFRAAFPGNERARLIIKGMNAETCANEWGNLKTHAACDSRICIIETTWPRARVLSLVQSCDAYVSLHRSEGFGRGPAEAMLLGKPVIVTDYSGTKDFCRSRQCLAGGLQPCYGQIW